MVNAVFVQNINSQASIYGYIGKIENYISRTENIPGFQDYLRDSCNYGSIYPINRSFGYSETSISHFSAHRYKYSIVFFPGYRRSRKKRKGSDEERVRMNVTPAERRGSIAKTTSCTPLAWLLFLFVFFSFLFLLLVLRSSFRLLQVVFSTVEHLTHEDGPLCSVPGCVQS